MRAKAKYYIELRGWTSERDHRLKWRACYEEYSRRNALGAARGHALAVCGQVNSNDCNQWFPHQFGEPIHKLGVRIRHKGRTLARWQNGKRVTT